MIPEITKVMGINPDVFSQPVRIWRIIFLYDIQKIIIIMISGRYFKDISAFVKTFVCDDQVVWDDTAMKEIEVIGTYARLEIITVFIQGKQAPVPGMGKRKPESVEIPDPVIFVEQDILCSLGVI
jgi:hypothetical protein